MAFVKCKASDGLRKQEATVEVVDFHGKTEFMPVDRGMLLQPGNGENYVAVTVIRIAEKEAAALISFPVETDSGAHRAWVPLAAMKDLEEAST